MSVDRLYKEAFGANPPSVLDIPSTEFFAYLSEVHARLRSALGDSLTLSDAAALAGLLALESFHCYDGFVISDDLSPGVSRTIGNKAASWLAASLTSDETLSGADVWRYYCWHDVDQDLLAIQGTIRERIVAGCRGEDNSIE